MIPPFPWDAFAEIARWLVAVGSTPGQPAPVDGVDYLGETDMLMYMFRAKPRTDTPDASVVRTVLVISEDGGEPFEATEYPTNNGFKIKSTTVQFSIARKDINNLDNESVPSAPRTYLVDDLVVPGQPSEVDVEFLGSVDE